MKEWISKLAPLILASLLLYMTPQMALANPNSDMAQVEGYMSSIMNKPYDDNDLAHKSLSRLFGGFIFEPFGEAPSGAATALSKVLGYTNVIAMILGVIIMSYVILGGALNTAASGEMLGRSWSSVWLPLRTSVAFGMIMPASSGGDVFSVAQSLVIWMIIVGSNSATWLWEKGADALISGDPMMPTMSFHDNKASKPIIDTVLCAAVRNHIISKKDGAPPVIGEIKSAIKSNPGEQGGNTQKFTNIMYSDFAGKSLENAIEIDFTNCGTVVLPNASEILNGTNLEEADGSTFGKTAEWEKSLQDAFVKSSRQRMPAFLSSAKTLADALILSELNGKGIEAAMTTGGDRAVEMESKINDNAKLYAATFLAYETYIQGVTQDTLAAVRSSNWKENMTKGGWMRAGAWFFETSRLQGFVQTLLSGINTGSTYSPSSLVDGSCIFTLEWSSCKSQKDEYTAWMNGFSMISAAAEKTPEAASAAGAKGNMQLKKTLSMGNKEVETMDAKSIDSISGSISALFLNTVMGLGEDDARGTGGNTTTGDTASFNNSAGNNMSNNVSGMISPFTAVSSLGRGLQQIGLVVWTAGLAASALLGATDGLVKDVINIGSGGIAGAAIGSVKYIMATIAPILAGVGGLAFMLAFAIPFMPVTIWIMLVCGYLVTVIEAVAAAPLAVIMLATPEGEGISGTNFAKALQMVNAVILRPSLSIVGLFAAMTLSYVAFAILNDLFWSVAGLTTNLSIFEVLALVFIYATLAFKVCEYMVSVIHKIPDQIMEWMGGGMTRPFGEDAAGGDMVGALKSNSAASGVSGVGGIQTAGKQMAEKMQRKQAMDRHNQMLSASKGRDEPTS